MPLRKEKTTIFQNDDEMIRHFRDNYAFFPTCVKLLSADGRLLYINAAGLEMIEAENDQQVVGIVVTDLIVEQYKQAFSQLHHTVFSGETGTLEYQVLGLKGTLFWFETRASPIYNIAGEVCAHLGISVDITARKLTEHSLAASEQKFRSLIEVIPQQIWSSEPLGKINFVSQQVEDYFGQPTAYFIEEGWRDVIHPDDWPLTIKKKAHSIATGTSFDIHYRLKRADNTYRWHIGRALPVYDEENQVTQWFGSNTDIDNLKKSEDALRASDANFAAAQASAKIGSWHRDLITKEAKWSLEMYRLFSYDPTKPPPSAEEFINNVHPEDRIQFAHLFMPLRDQLTISQNSYSFDFRYPDQNGDYLWFEDKVEILLNEAGKPIASIWHGARHHFTQENRTCVSNFRTTS